MANLTFYIDEKKFSVALYEEPAPQTSQLLKSITPFRSTLLHAKFSGWMVLAKVPELKGLPVETESTYLSPGSVVVHPGHYELGIAYDITQFREPTGPVYVTKVGQIIDNLDALREIGSRVHREGPREIKVIME